MIFHGDNGREYDKEPTSGSLFFGVEIELAAISPSIVRQISGKLLTTDECDVGGDGSIDYDRGREVRFHPMTYDFMKNHSRSLRMLFSDRRLFCPNGYGMHVHVSAMRSFRALPSIARFIVTNRAFCHWLSRRPVKSTYATFSASAFTAFDTAKALLSCKEGPDGKINVGHLLNKNAARFADSSISKPKAGEHLATTFTQLGRFYNRGYEALAFNDGYGTAEFRLFQGTTRELEFFSNIQFVKLMCESAGKRKMINLDQFFAALDKSSYSELKAICANYDAKYAENLFTERIRNRNPDDWKWRYSTNMLSEDENFAFRDLARPLPFIPRACDSATYKEEYEKCA